MRGIIMLAAVGFGTSIGAQSKGATDSASRTPLQHTALGQYEGVYAYHGNTTLTLIAADTILFAVIDEARYPLHPLGGDRFMNSGGDTIPFRRTPAGVVSGFEERGIFFARHTSTVDSATAAAVRATPRPLGADGRPVLYLYAVPPQLGDGLRVGNLTEAGFDSATVARIVARVTDGSYPDVHGLLVYRGGRLVIEEYFYGFDRDKVHQMRSASKSAVSALVGIAIDHGALKSESDLVTQHLPYRSYANPDPRKDRLTLRDLLTMRSGLACDDWDDNSPGNESRVYQSEDWVKFVLDLPMIDPPGTKGHYCSGNVMVAGRIVERATGKPLLAFAQENLFTPLGIKARDVRWNYTLSSSNAATFAQLYMRPRDMLKLGILFQQQGKWGTRQVVSRAWIARSTAHWSTVGDQDYGYFWWHQWVNASTSGGTRRVDMVVATGNGGQKIYIVPSLDLVVVVTGGNYNSHSPAMEIMGKDLLPALLKH